ncbi:murein hydrolase activator EnvC family protein [Priestia taiwanensis]|uniref:Peptidase M24 n=1 Tax=Priestia taiwanensis TaxID=1347902 RepID=A0A917AYJ8_9BACI|nr:M23 family metallopeptidase [Priestia taiwanensis]MBM7364401.1 murein DD-endopeptidase MepM/ murein hydrolase activator NlpD [Priestia taiwanensis]GGE81685.1 peptidase M24 [Priestia taiwanensis]
MKKTATVVTAFMLGFSSLATITSSTVYAEGNLSEVKEKKQQVEAEKQQAQNTVNELATEMAKLAEELRLMDEKLAETEQQVEEKREVVTKTKEEIEKLKEEIIELEKRIELRTEILKQRAVSFQEQGGGVPYLDVVLSAESFADLITRIDSVAKIMQADNEIVRQNEEDLSQVEANKKEVDAKLEMNEIDLKALEAAEATLKAQSEQKKEIVNKIEAQKQQAEGEVERLGYESNLLAQEEEAIIKAQEEAARQLEEERKRQEAAAAAAEANKPSQGNGGSNGGSVVGPTPPVSSGFFMRPAAGRVTSEIGDGRGHKGVDIASSGTVPIVAAGDGRVSRSEYSPSYGEVIYITHNVNGKTMTSVYAHMRSGSRSVSVGQSVKKGQQIGLMGNTGNSFGQHLHFELHAGPWTQDKRYFVDPRKYINF